MVISPNNPVNTIIIMRPVVVCPSKNKQHFKEGVYLPTVNFFSVGKQLTSKRSNTVMLLTVVTRFPMSAGLHCLGTQRPQLTVGVQLGNIVAISSFISVTFIPGSGLMMYENGSLSKRVLDREK